MDIQFRKGTVENLDDCVKAMENSTMCTSYFPSEESRKKAVMEGIDRGTLYVVLCNGECAGFAYFILEGAFHAYHYLHLIAIKEEYRGKGIGKKLLEFIEDILFKTKDKIFLLVGDYNSGAKIFYEKLGYQYIGTIPSLYRKGIDEYLMMKLCKEGNIMQH
ncbi:GNAT family N-acetyltransferase [Lachnoclostridium phytofermentans]|uniref:GNAT family N-acetyltransferase n=1 Tax=Lachnoclostridium phytofermentans TaxID=66219 RepID=UPI0002D2D36A|nr:GNAT family N-acetyltransferase [Lachnoclostridium phytofermentans]